jgi:C-terminal processing protease CtpA/Prc
MRTPFLNAVCCFLLFGTFYILPAGGCRKAVGLNNPSPTAAAVFEEVREVMNSRYSLFSVKNINWDSTGDFYRSQLYSDITDKALFTLVEKMLTTLKDGHVALLSNTDTAVYTSFYSTYPRNFNLQTVLNNYLKKSYQSAYPVIYKVENNIGYLYYHSFDDPITDNTLDNIMLAMKPTKGLIIDIRSNNGGNAANAAKLFSRFIMSNTLVKYEAFKKGEGRLDFYDPQPFYIAPSGNFYGQPVCVLINRGCYSTCNDFALYMSSLPNTRLIGDQTGGGGGIPNEYLLQNGWKLRYTATMTLSPGKKSTENGIPATVIAGITAQDDQNGKDPILEKAIQLLQ